VTELTKHIWWKDNVKRESKYQRDKIDKGSSMNATFHNFNYLNYRSSSNINDYINSNIDSVGSNLQQIR